MDFMFILCILYRMESFILDISYKSFFFGVGKEISICIIFYGVCLGEGVEVVLDDFF